jgi:uncharacterized protein YecE (DUF72 family)
VNAAGDPRQIRIGISSWGGLPGFYPSGVKAGDRLSWYARFFSVVEINVSFYRLVRPDTYRRWSEATPATFVFDVKAFQELTHFREPPPDATFDAFRGSYEPLREAGKLGGILWQFPPRFTNSPAARAYLRRIAALMAGDLSIVEFRHYSWLTPEEAPATLQILEELGLAYAVTDEPQIPQDTVPLVVAATSPALAYLRLHGRNAATWYRGGGGTRYDYDYSGTEIQELAGICWDLAARARAVHVMFNNNARGAGTRNALALAELLGIAPHDAPPLPPTQAALFADEI